MRTVWRRTGVSDPGSKRRSANRPFSSVHSALSTPCSEFTASTPHCEYVRQWVPELAALPNKYIHRPWTTPEDILREARVDLGHPDSYCKRVVLDVDTAREASIAAIHAIRSTAGVEFIDVNGYDTIKLPPGSAKAGSVKGDRIRIFTKNAIRSSHQTDIGQKGAPKMQEGRKSKKLRSGAPQKT